MMGLQICNPVQLCQSDGPCCKACGSGSTQTLMLHCGGFEAPRRMVGQHEQDHGRPHDGKGPSVRYEGKPRRLYPNVTREEAGAGGNRALLFRALRGKLGLLVSNFADHGKIGKDELDDWTGLRHEDGERAPRAGNLISSTVLIQAFDFLRGNSIRACNTRSSAARRAAAACCRSRWSEASRRKRTPSQMPAAVQRLVSIHRRARRRTARKPGADDVQEAGNCARGSADTADR